MKRLLFLLFAVPGFTNCFSQGVTPVDATKNDSAGIRSIVSALTRYSAAFPVEKVYLQLDKPAYAPGDTIWYKAYTVIGPRHQPSALSGVLYVELIGPEDTVITREVLKLNAGIAAGDIQLSALMPQRNYRLRAYTNWMRNAGPDYFYDQTINIGIPPKQANSHEGKRYPDIQFFPEGGNIINGVRSRVAVKVVDTTGLGSDVSGTIEDSTGDTVTTFTTQHLGMGIFALTPQSGKSYKAIIKIPGRNAYPINLPAALETGVTLTINARQQDSIYIKVATNEKTVATLKNSTFYLTAQSGGKLFYTSAGKLGGLIFTAGVDKKRFPSGISQFTLFTGDGEPAAERIVFIENDDTLHFKITATTNMQTEGNHRASLDFQVQNSAQKAVQGNFSVAIINEDKVAYNPQSESTIISNLLLTSDLRGYIENPGYYFINRNDQTRADLDILMLTQGYRRFEWKHILRDTIAPPACPAERSLSIGGNVKTDKGKPMPKAKVSLAAMPGALFRDTIADVNGKFTFTDLDLTDSSRLMLRLAGKHINDDVKITVMPASYPVIKRVDTPADATAALTPSGISLKKVYDDLQAQAALQHAKQLKEVVIRANKIKPADVPYSDNLNGIGSADQVIKADKLGDCISLSDCLTGRIAGVYFHANGVPTLIRAQSRVHVPPMIIIVDGIVENADRINEIDPKEVNTVEVLTSGANLAIYGLGASGGALIITMKKGAAQGAQASDIVRFAFKGYYQERTFYTPKYPHAETDPEFNQTVSTIYWNPNIGSDKDGRASIQYTSSGAKGNYRIVIEGIDDDGNLGRQVLRYKVE
jgi:hypothetical protein